MSPPLVTRGDMILVLIMSRRNLNLGPEQVGVETQDHFSSMFPVIPRTG
jgi:hypothetical protein